MRKPAQSFTAEVYRADRPGHRRDLGTAHWPATEVHQSKVARGLGAARLAETTWHQHWDALAIFLVDRTELRNQIPFLEPDTDENVSGGHGSKQQMPGGHVRRCPEGEQEAQHDRMAHNPV